MSSRQFHCRRCGSSQGRRSRAHNVLEKYLLPVFMLRAVRCLRCQRRYYRPVFEHLHPEKPAPAVS